MTLRCLCPEPSHTPRWGHSPGAWAPLWGQEALGGTSGGGQRGWRWLQLRERSCRGAEQGEGLEWGGGLGLGSERAHSSRAIVFASVSLLQPPEPARPRGTALPGERAEAEQQLVTCVTAWLRRLLSPSPFVSVCWCSEIPVSPQQTVPLQERPGMSVDRSTVRRH